MKVFFVTTIARQMEGDMIAVRFEKVFLQASKADAYAKDLAKVTTESIQTPYGPVTFYCERGVHEAEVEDAPEETRPDNEVGPAIHGGTRP